MTNAGAGRKQHTVWKAIKEFFPGLFDNETFIDVGHELAQGWHVFWSWLDKALYRLFSNDWSARWGLIALSGALIWVLYCAPEISVHELASRHPSEIQALRVSVTKFGENEANLNGDWEEHYALWDVKSAKGKRLLSQAEDLQFRRYIGEPLARLLPDRDGVGTEGLHSGEYVMRLEFLDGEEHPYFTLLVYPDACYYAKDGWGAENKFLPVVLKNEESSQTLCRSLFSLCE